MCKRLTLDEWEKALKILLSAVTIFAIVVGGLFGLWEYLDKKHQNKVANVLALQSKFSSGDVIAAQQQLDYSYIKNLISISKANDKDNPSASADFYNLIVEIVRRERLDQSIERVLYFYKEVALCGAAEICDKETIEEYFGNSGRVFFHQYYPYICQLRVQQNDQGIWMTVQDYFKPSLGKDFCLNAP